MLCGVEEERMWDWDPMEGCLMNSPPPPRPHCHTGGARPTFTAGEPLRWDQLSRGAGGGDYSLSRRTRRRPTSSL